jgi:hypothetical protein
LAAKSAKGSCCSPQRKPISAPIQRKKIRHQENGNDQPRLESGVGLWIIAAYYTQSSIDSF